MCPTQTVAQSTSWPAYQHPLRSPRSHHIYPFGNCGKGLPRELHSSSAFASSPAPHLVSLSSKHLLNLPPTSSQVLQFLAYLTLSVPPTYSSPLIQGPLSGVSFVDECVVVYVFVRMDAMHPICMCNSLLLHACLFNCDLVRIYLMTATGIPFSSPSSSLAPYLHLSLASLFNVSLSHHYQQVQLSRDTANSLPCGLRRVLRSNVLT